MVLSMIIITNAEYFIIHLGGFMRIIILKGKSNVGKTSSMILLRKILLDNNFEEIFSDDGESDFCSVFQFKTKMVGLLSGGDNIEIIKNGFSLIEKYKCDIVICTSRTKGEGLKYVQRLSDSIQNIDKPYIPHNLIMPENLHKQYQKKINQITAEFLYDELNNAEKRYE